MGKVPLMNAAWRRRCVFVDMARHAPLRQNQQIAPCMPLPSEYGTYKTVKAIYDSQGHIRQSRPYKTVKAIKDSQGHIRQSRPYSGIVFQVKIP